MNQQPFGAHNGAPVSLYTLSNPNGLSASITNFGAILTQLHVPDRNGKLANVVLGFDSLPPYQAKHPYFGATIGRVANRIANSQFSLDGKTYKLFTNNLKACLHGGEIGFDKQVWQASPHPTPDGESLKLSLISPDLQENFPGTLHVTVTYTLTKNNELKIQYHATTDAPTILNLTNHSYFNLAGAGNGTILDHQLTLHAQSYTVADPELVPTGRIAPVKNSPMDFTTPHTVGERIQQVPGGYDHNYVLSTPTPNPNSPHPAAKLRDPASGRTLTLLTTQPGVQFYSGNFLDGSLTGIGGPYQKHAALCLETQHFPDAPHHPTFPSIVLRPGQIYNHTSTHHFTME